MRPQLQILVSNRSNVPYAEVPRNFMWDLIEYLSIQRVGVTYDFKETFFTVRFPYTNMRAAQEILDEWAQAPVGLPSIH